MTVDPELLKPVIERAFGLRAGSLCDRDRRRRYTRARGAAYLILSTKCGMNYSAIAKAFGRHRDSILFGCVAAQADHDSDPDFRRRYAEALASLRQPATT